MTPHSFNTDLFMLVAGSNFVGVILHLQKGKVFFRMKNENYLGL